MSSPYEHGSWHGLEEDETDYIRGVRGSLRETHQLAPELITSSSTLKFCLKNRSFRNEDRPDHHFPPRPWDFCHPSARLGEHHRGGEHLCRH